MRPDDAQAVGLKLVDKLVNLFLALTSTPRVGSSRMSTFGRVINPRAIATFADYRQKAGLSPVPLTVP